MMKIKRLYSFNFDKKKRSNKSIKNIVIHYTGMQSERESITRLCSKKYKVSSHFVVTKNGKILRLVEDNRVAWHAGKSSWGKYKNLNKNSIGIELVNRGHKLGYTSFEKKQLISLIQLCKKLVNKYKIKKQNVVGHSDIAPLRKIDPGEKFPWQELANKKIGIWHSFNSKELIKYRRLKISNKEKFKFSKNLIKIGYYFPDKKKYTFMKIVKAFHRHFRKELVNGIVDKESLIISQNISKKI